jgi:hypothetical protein
VDCTGQAFIQALQSPPAVGSHIVTMDTPGFRSLEGGMERGREGGREKVNDNTQNATLLSLTTISRWTQKL